MKRLLSISLAIMFMAVSAGMALAHGHHRPELNLTPEQVTKMHQIYAESHPVIHPIKQQIQAKRTELKTQIYSPTPNKGKIESLAREIGVLQGKIYVERANMNAKCIKEGLPAGPGNFKKGGMMGMGRAMKAEPKQ